MPDSWVPIATVADSPPGSTQELVAGGRIVALFNIDGDYFALDGVCPHQGGPIGKGFLCGEIVTCPWHGWQFNVRSGQHQLNAKFFQPRFETKVEGGMVFVRIDSASD